VWTKFVWYKQGLLADPCEHSNENSGFFNVGETLDCLIYNHLLLNKDSALWDSSLTCFVCSNTRISTERVVEVLHLLFPSPCMCLKMC
jgi:hypothetical protein